MDQSLQLAAKIILGFTIAFGVYIRVDARREKEPGKPLIGDLVPLAFPLLWAIPLAFGLSKFAQGVCLAAQVPVFILMVLRTRANRRRRGAG